MQLINFITENNAMVSTAIGAAGLILSGFGVYYGRKAYVAANNIFENGIRMDKKKVLEQVSLELVISFFIPFSKFKIATDPFRDKPYEKRVSYLNDALSNTMFQVKFPYFDMHKGELWDSLDSCGEAGQAKAFNRVVAFVEKAHRLEQSIHELQKILDDYLRQDKGSKANDTLEQFFAERPNVNKELFDKGLDLLDELEELAEKLPEELEIEKMKSLLSRG